jgi:hypothetical protein
MNEKNMKKFLIEKDASCSRRGLAMRKILFIIILLLASILPVSAQNQTIKWHPVCRHNALYWAITVREQYPTRIVYGHFKNSNGDTSYHVQPQVKLGKHWYYFKVENGSVFIILNMDKWTGDDDTDVWVPTHYYNLKEYLNQMEKWREDDE